MNAILQVENLTKQYADFKLDHVSFSVPKGTIMGAYWRKWSRKKHNYQCYS